MNGLWCYKTFTSINISQQRHQIEWKQSLLDLFNQFVFVTVVEQTKLHFRIFNITECNYKFRHLNRHFAFSHFYRLLYYFTYIFPGKMITVIFTCTDVHEQLPENSELVNQRWQIQLGFVATFFTDLSHKHFKHRIYMSSEKKKLSVAVAGVDW